MSNSTNMVSASAMPPQEIPSFPNGSNSPRTAGLALQQQQSEAQNSRNALSGGKRRKYRGGQAGVANSATVIEVPPVPSGAINPGAIGGNYAGLTALASNAAAQSVYDDAQNPGDTAIIAAQQKAGAKWKKGGSKSKSRKGGSKWKKGGSWPVWGCLSGGKKTRRKTKKHRKTKRRHH